MDDEIQSIPIRRKPSKCRSGTECNEKDKKPLYKECRCALVLDIESHGIWNRGATPRSKRFSALSRYEKRDDRRVFPDRIRPYSPFLRTKSTVSPPSPVTGLRVSTFAQLRSRQTLFTVQGVSPSSRAAIPSFPRWYWRLSSVKNKQTDYSSAFFVDVWLSCVYVIRERKKQESFFGRTHKEIRATHARLDEQLPEILRDRPSLCACA